MHPPVLFPTVKYFRLFVGVMSDKKYVHNEMMVIHDATGIVVIILVTLDLVLGNSKSKILY